MGCNGGGRRAFLALGRGAFGYVFRREQEHQTEHSYKSLALLYRAVRYGGDGALHKIKHSGMTVGLNSGRFLLPKCMC